MFFMKKNEPRGERLSASNLNTYLSDTYGAGRATVRNTISRITPVIQAEWGGANDCSLCSVMSIGGFYEGYKRTFDQLYNAIVAAANKYFYDPNKFGTIPIFINDIIDDVFTVKSKRKYLKGIGFSWKLIKKNIDAGIPMVLSVNNDGRNYYINHSVVITGYIEYSNGAQILTVFDNWTKTASFVDFKKVSMISSLNYIE